MAYFGFTNKLIKGETIKIFNYGNCKRDFTYVDDIVEGLKEENVNVVIYEPTLKDDTFADCRVIKDFKEFSNESDVIIANRFEATLEPVKDKIYTRDIFFRD